MSLSVIELRQRYIDAGSPKTQNIYDPKLMAGSYLDWANGDIDKALDALEILLGGEKPDLTPFPGSFEALQILTDIKLKMLPL